jgi:hypothetical protein
MRDFARRRCGVLAMILLLAGCQTGAKSQPEEPPSMSSTPSSSPPPATQPVAGTISPSDLRDALAELDKGHHDKMKLAFWVSTPFKSINPAFKPFYEEMGRSQKELAGELESWAKSHKVDLTYHYENGPMSQGQKIMEDRSEKEARADDKEDFERDMLINMKQDFGWNLSLILALQKRVTDPALASYLEKSRHVHEEGLATVKELLKKYKFSG